MDESVELLDGGAEVYPRMLAAIEGARERVVLQVYDFAAKGIGARFIDALVDAARRGVDVSVELDGWGSASTGLLVASRLRSAGVRTRIHNRLRRLVDGKLDRNHRKILLVDDEIAFLGGLNIRDEFVGSDSEPAWEDVAVEIRSPGCASLGRALRRDSTRADVSPRVRIWLSRFGGGWRLRGRYLRAFRDAQRHIHLAHAYFLPDRAVVRSLIRAARRGVRVRALLAGSSDVALATVATRRLYRKLTRAGVEIWEWDRSVLHAKVATVDDRRLLVGSFNLDPLSMVNREALVDAADPKVAASAREWIEARLAESRSVTADATASPWTRWVVEPTGSVLYRLARRASAGLLRTAPSKGIQVAAGAVSDST